MPAATVPAVARGRSTSPRSRCPMTWVRTKLELERMAPGEALDVRCRAGRGAGERARARRARPGTRSPSRARRSGSCAHESSRRALLRASSPAPRRDVAAAAQPRRGRRSRRRSPLTDAELERYSRQLVLPEWGERRAAARSATRACWSSAPGALGSPVALYLAGAGVGRLGIVDDDAVELSNLHRQLLHFTPDVGVPKAHSAAAKLGFLNPEVVVEPYQVRLDAANAAGAGRGAGPRGRLLATRSRPATPSTPPAAPRASRWWRAA